MKLSFKIAETLFLLVLLLLASQSFSYAADWGLNDTQTAQWRGTATPFHSAIEDAFTRHQVIMLGDYHWNEKVMTSYIHLLEQPRFLDEVKNLVVEFGNSRYQSQLDGYLNGDSNDSQIIDTVRREALFFTAWMPQVYEDFFNTIRRYNLKVKDSEKVKVWLAEAPFFWEKVRDRAEWQQAANNKTDGFFRTATNAIKTNDKVLMIFGAFHLLDVVDAPESVSRPLATRLKEVYPNQILTVWPITESKVTKILSPLTKASLLLTNQLPPNTLRFVDVLPKAKIRLQTYGAEVSSAEALVDGLLYVGESEQRRKFPEAVLADKAWVSTMDTRLSLIGGRTLSAYQTIMANSVNN